MNDMSAVAALDGRPQLQLAMATEPRYDLSGTEIYRMISPQISQG